MTIWGCVLLFLWMGVIPLCIGGNLDLPVDGRQKSYGFMWVSGYMLMWALFQLLSVPMILRGARFEILTKHYAGLLLIAAAAGAGHFVYRYRKRSRLRLAPALEKRERIAGLKSFLWLLFAALVLLQLVLSVCLTYADGDDAYYVAVSTLTVDGGTMYQKLPYSMGETALDVRHGLAPFPIWIAFLSKVSGVPAVSVAHVVVSTVLIFMTYVIFFGIGRGLFPERRERLPLFLCMTALLVIFGDYSFYTAENFMLARSRQGKAALGNIIVPMVIYLFLLIFQRIQEHRKVEARLWVLLAATVTGACLCTTLGTFLMCLFLGVIGLCGGIVYRKWGLIWRTAVCCIPAVGYALLYFVLCR